MKNELSPRVRLEKMKAGEKVDRLPVSLFHGTVGAKLVGLSYSDAYETAENLAHREIECYRNWGVDDVSITYNLTLFGRSLGSQSRQRGDDSPIITEFVLNDLSEMEHLDFSKINVEEDAELSKHLDALNLINEAIGEEVDITYDLVGPLTAAASLYPPEKMLRAMRRDADRLHQLLETITQQLLIIMEGMSKNSRIRFSISDPVSSGDLISPKQYREFSTPYVKRLVDYAHELNRSIYIHICGNTLPILDEVIATGIDMISLDQKVDLEKASEIIKDQAIILGNVDPVAILLNGDEKAVEEAVAECFEKAGHHPGGFVIGTGCSVPYDTPVENINTYLETAKKLAHIYAQK